MSSSGDVPLDALLAHRGWVRRLARSMVRDDAAADDVEQRTWLAVLRSRPRGVASVRAWLSRVVRNQALDAARDASRRAVHERAAARGEHAPAAGDVVADAEAHGRVVAAVLRLAEPYRTTVLLRFYDDAPPRVVAERMGVPVETVRTRLRRALAALRDDLGRAGGDAWLGALAPLLAAPRGTTETAIAGGTAMGAKTTVAVAAAVALAAGWAGGSAASPAAPAASAPETASLERRIAVLETARRPAERARAASAGDDDARVLHERVDALERELAEVRRSRDAAPAVAGAPRQPPGDALAGLGVEELFALMRARGRETFRTAEERRTVGRRTLEVCDALLAHPDVGSRRVEVLLCKGWSCAQTEDLDASDAAYAAARDAAGPATPYGRDARFRIAVNLSSRGQGVAAGEAILGLASECPAPEEGARLRAVGASYFRTTDPERCRREAQAVVDEFGTRGPEFANAVSIARRELDRLDGRPLVRSR